MQDMDSSLRLFLRQQVPEIGFLLFVRKQALSIIAAIHYVHGEVKRNDPRATSHGILVLDFCLQY